jgi:spore coat polysaccharide biosynthesis protein SpsF
MEVGQSGKQIPKAGIIIQARMDSVRLPGKVLMTIGSSTMFEILVKRLKKSGLPIILATSDANSNDKLIAVARALEILFYRGSEDDVLSRYYEAAKANNVRVIVRVTGDNPLVDGEFIRCHVDDYIKLNNENLYMSTGISKTLPVGISFEIFSFSMLETAYRRASTIKEREHVTPYFYTHPELYDFFPVMHATDKSAYRLTVDTMQDLELIRLLVEEYNADKLTYKEIISVMDKDRDLSNINIHVRQKKWNE